LGRPELFEAPAPVAPEKEIEIKEIERIIAAKCTCECNYEFKETKPFTPRRDSGYASPDEDSMDSSPIPSRSSSPAPTLARTIEDCVVLHKSQKTDELRDYELIELVLRGAVPAHSLEKALKDPLRAVKVRRSVISRTMSTRAQAALDSSNLPWQDYDYSSIMGCCAENVIGFMPLPVGVAGPLTIDGQPVFLPMATTEGTLIASTSRGCKLLNTAGGVTTVATNDGMSRGPCGKFDNVIQAAEAKAYMESAEGLAAMKEAFSRTTRHGKLTGCKARMAGPYLYLRFTATTGEAMGMNMMGKGCQQVLNSLRNELGFPHMKIVTVSGNYCTDKKPASINWTEGRGKSVVAEAIIPAEEVQKTLRTSVAGLCQLNISKNLVGSALAGTSAGGFNAHASNIVAAMFLATGQDPAQVMASANCLTLFEE